MSKDLSLFEVAELWEQALEGELDLHGERRVRLCLSVVTLRLYAPFPWLSSCTQTKFKRLRTEARNRARVPCFWAGEKGGLDHGCGCNRAVGSFVRDRLSCAPNSCYSRRVQRRACGCFNSRLLPREARRTVAVHSQGQLCDYSLGKGQTKTRVLVSNV